MIAARQVHQGPSGSSGFLIILIRAYGRGCNSLSFIFLRLLRSHLLAPAYQDYQDRPGVHDARMVGCSSLPPVPKHAFARGSCDHPTVAGYARPRCVPRCECRKPGNGNR